MDFVRVWLPKMAEKCLHAVVPEAATNWRFQTRASWNNWPFRCRPWAANTGFPLNSDLNHANLLKLFLLPMNRFCVTLCFAVTELLRMWGHSPKPLLPYQKRTFVNLLKETGSNVSCAKHSDSTGRNFYNLMQTPMHHFKWSLSIWTAKSAHTISSTSRCPVFWQAFDKRYPDFLNFFAIKCHECLITLLQRLNPFMQRCRNVD